MTDLFAAHDLKFYDIASALLADVNTRLLDTIGGQPERICVYPGLIAWDDCTCGQLAGSIMSVYPSDSFPQPFTGRAIGEAFSCTPAYVVADVVISLVRCAPQPADNELAPSCEALAAAARIWTVDAAVVRRSVICLLEELKDTQQIIEYRLERQTPVGPEGACVGTDTRVLIGVEF